MSEQQTQSAAEGTRRKCRLCSVPLAMVVKLPKIDAPPDAKPTVIPLDTRAPVYVVWMDSQGREWCRPVKDWLWELLNAGVDELDALLNGVSGVHVTHYASCPAASSFSRKGKDAAPAENR